MAEYRLPVRGATSDRATVFLRESEIGVLTQIAGWGRFDAAAEAALRPLALSLPADCRTPIRCQAGVVWRIAPNKVLVGADASPGIVGNDDLAVLDLSDARVGVTIGGPGAAGLLARVMAIDFSEPAFPVGTFVQGGLHHVGVLVERRAPDVFDLLMPTTWAVSLTDFVAGHVSPANAS